MRWFPGSISGNHVRVLIVHLHAHKQTYHHQRYHDWLLMFKISVFRVYCLICGGVCVLFVVFVRY